MVAKSRRESDALGRLVVVGQGYVGLPLAMQAVRVGWDVVGFDVDRQRVKWLATAESFVEDVTSDELSSALRSGRYRATADPEACAGFDVAVVTVPTPLRDGSPDLSFIDLASRTLASKVRPGCTVVLESTTYPGTTEELVAPILEQISGLIAGRDFHLGYSPERIDPGNGTWTLATTPKVVSGVTPGSLAAVRAFYDTLVDRTVPVSSTGVAEMTKLLENTFRHVNIAMVNELAMFAADLGVDLWEAIEAASTKPFGFMPFTPGPGVGGHCLPIDPSYLSWRVQQTAGRPFRFVELANDVNEHMPDYVVTRLIAGLNRRNKALNRSRILLLGLTYKRNSGDARESPAVAVAQRLLAFGANVRAVDPYVLEAHVPSGVLQVDLDREEVGDADAVVLLTDHDVFDGADLQTAAYVLDTRHRLDGPKVEHL